MPCIRDGWLPQHLARRRANVEGLHLESQRAHCTLYTEGMHTVAPRAVDQRSLVDQPARAAYRADAGPRRRGRSTRRWTSSRLARKHSSSSLLMTTVAVADR